MECVPESAEHGWPGLPGRVKPPDRQRNKREEVALAWSVEVAILSPRLLNKEQKSLKAHQVDHLKTKKRSPERGAKGSFTRGKSFYL
jgi:hypothetical protein